MADEKKPAWTALAWADKGGLVTIEATRGEEVVRLTLLKEEARTLAFQLADAVA